MSSWLQEAIEEKTLGYPIRARGFDAAGWRMLCEAFVKYLETLELTREYKLQEYDEWLLESIFQAENLSKDIISVVRFLEATAPPAEWTYAGSTFKERAEVCEEFEDVLENERQRMYEEMWLRNVDEQKGEE